MPSLAALIPVLSWVILNVAAGVLLVVPVRHRLYGLPAILTPATISFKTIQRLNFIPGLAELWGTITLISLVHFSSLLFIKKWKFRVSTTRKATERTSHPIDIWLNRSLWAQLYKVVSSPRFVRIPYKHVILFRPSTGNRVKSTAIHKKFSPARILWLLIKIVIHGLLNLLAVTLVLGSLDASDFTPAKAMLLRRLLPSSVYSTPNPVSNRELMVRIWFTLNALWAPIMMLDIIHAMLAILFIYVLRIDTPDDWPDLFGNPREAFTLGRFWTQSVQVQTPPSRSFS